MPAPYENHRAQLKAILSAWGMPDENAEATADILSWADLHGVDSHGMSMIPQTANGPPGTIIDQVETDWPRERDSRIVERENFGAMTSRLWKTLREESLKTMGRAGNGA